MSNASILRVGRSALLAVIAAGAVVVACAGGSAGDKCTKNSDCNGALTCQPVEGRDSDYCCGTYGPDQPDENIPANCKPADAGSPEPTGSDAGSTTPVEDAATSGG